VELWLSAYSCCVNWFCPESTNLVVNLLDMPWLSSSKMVTSRFTSFLGNLVSAQPHLTAVVVRRMVDLLRYRT
jgi:hypothetical protein